jgi:hypothetical protein
MKKQFNVYIFKVEIQKIRELNVIFKIKEIWILKSFWNSSVNFQLSIKERGDGEKDILERVERVKT